MSDNVKMITVESTKRLKKEADIAILYAVEHNLKDLVMFLIKAGANVNARKNLALKMAVRYSTYDIVDYLINVGANSKVVDKKDMIFANQDIKRLITTRKRENSLWYKLFD